MRPMNDSHVSTAGIEVQERALDCWELGFLAGVFAAWGIKNADDGEYRDAISLLMAQKQEAQLLKPLRPELRLVNGGQGQGTPGV
jgi:hypothetical protein